MITTQSQPPRQRNLAVADALAVGLLGPVLIVIKMMGYWDDFDWPTAAVCSLVFMSIGFSSAWSEYRKFPKGTAEVTMGASYFEYWQRGWDKVKAEYGEITSVEPGLGRTMSHIVFYGGDGSQMYGKGEFRPYEEGELRSCVAVMDLRPWMAGPVGDWSRQMLWSLDEHEVPVDDSVRRLLDHDLVEKSLR